MHRGRYQGGWPGSRSRRSEGGQRLQPDDDRDQELLPAALLRGQAVGRISGIVLAGGTSSRLGRPKQLLDLDGRPVLQHVVDAAAAGGLDEIVVVLGHRATEVAGILRLPEAARTTVNPDFAAGQSTSLRVGLGAASAEASAAVVLLGDQPGVSAEAIRAVVEAYRRTGGRVVRAWYGSRPGHPVLLDREVWAEVAAEEGDRGARDVLARHPEWEVRVDLGGTPPPDLDTWEDYERLVGSRQPRGEPNGG